MTDFEMDRPRDGEGHESSEHGGDQTGHHAGEYRGEPAPEAQDQSGSPDASPGHEPGTMFDSIPDPVPVPENPYLPEALREPAPDMDYAAPYSPPAAGAEDAPEPEPEPEFEPGAEPEPTLGLGLDLEGMEEEAAAEGAGSKGEALPPLPQRPGDQMDLGQDFVQEPIAPRVYYSIGEVCDLTGLKPHVLRYWESQFEVMNPTKNRAGNRVYRRKDIDLIFLVKRLLYEEKYTIDGARQKLLDMRKEGALDDEKQEVLGPEFLAEMNRELRALKELLTLPEVDG